MLSSLILATTLSISATPERVGLFVGSNGAPAGRTPLVHAEADARAMRRVFVELGGLAPEAAYLLEAPTATTLLEAIQRTAQGARVLVFYYSGHADARALLLEGSELSFAELSRALAATGAELRLELVDACRSGAMTRKKGASLGQRIDVSTGEVGEGRVVITSSAEWEDSHESDTLGGSFFTLHMTTGLRGAADVDRDGQVTLSEAYRYVYGRTVESTLGAGAGVQHPTFAYELTGRGELILTWPPRAGGRVAFRAGDYLVIDPATGRVAAEVTSPTASLTLPAGSYRVHKRTRSEVLSGTVVVVRGQEVDADAFLDEREAHARLVRKGREADPGLSHAVRVELGVRGPIAEPLGAVPMLRVGYELVLPWLSVMPYVSGTLASTLSTPRLVWQTQELGAGLRFSRALDTPWLTVRGGLMAEVVRLHEAERDAREAARTGVGAALAAQLALESPPLVGDLFVAASLEAALYVYRGTSAVLEPTGEGEVYTRPTYRAHAALGWEF